MKFDVKGDYIFTGLLGIKSVRKLKWKRGKQHSEIRDQAFRENEVWIVGFLAENPVDSNCLSVGVTFKV